MQADNARSRPAEEKHRTLSSQTEAQCTACANNLQKVTMTCHILHNPVMTLPIYNCDGCNPAAVEGYCATVGSGHPAVTHDECFLACFCGPLMQWLMHAQNIYASECSNGRLGLCDDRLTVDRCCEQCASSSMSRRSICRLTLTSRDEPRRSGPATQSCVWPIDTRVTLGPTLQHRIPL